MVSLFGCFWVQVTKDSSSRSHRGSYRLRQFPHLYKWSAGFEDSAAAPADGSHRDGNRITNRAIASEDRRVGLDADLAFLGLTDHIAKGVGTRSPDMRSRDRVGAHHHHASLGCGKGESAFFFFGFHPTVRVMRLGDRGAAGHCEGSPDGGELGVALETLHEFAVGRNETFLALTGNPLTGQESEVRNDGWRKISDLVVCNGCLRRGSRDSEDGTVFRCRCEKLPAEPSARSQDQDPIIRP